LTYIYNPHWNTAARTASKKAEEGGGEMAAHAEMDVTKTALHNAVSLPRVPQPADENDVMREQLEYLIAHATERDACGCSMCQRYLRARSLLLEIFSEPEPQPAPRPTALPMAA
jgi:hypothetical protein